MPRVMLLLLLLLSSCATAESARTSTTPEAFRRALAALGSCDDPTDHELALDPARPLVVLVHGCNASRHDFRGLSAMFSLREQQTICYRYDDRERITDSASRLRAALGALAREAPEREVLVIGHSQGGLVARAALSNLAGPVSLAPAHYRLVTVSSPFGGIGAARHCGSIPFHIATFGVTMGICRAIGGAKWNEIHARATLVRHPPSLSPLVREHLAIVTDERYGCRRYAADGRTCAQHDFVFSVAEQHSARIARDDRVIERRVAAGHAEIVGTGGGEPQKLLQVLEHAGLLGRVRPDQQSALERLRTLLGW